MSEWKRVKLGEVAKMMRGKAVTRSRIIPGDIPVMLGGREPAYYCNEANHTGPCFIVSRSGASAGYVSYWDEPIFVTDGFLFEADSKDDTQFLYYSLKARQQSLIMSQNGTGIPHVRGEDLKNIELAFPTEEERKRIAAILSDYDAAIANCRKQIALLEEAAMRLYREWAKKDMGKKVLLVDVVEVVYGFPFEGKLFNSKGDGLPIVRIRNVPEGESNDYTVETAPDRYVVRDGDLLIGMDGEFYVNFWSGGDAYLVQRTCRLRPNEARLTGFVREAIRKPIEEFQAAIVGSTVGHLGKRDIDTIKITMPTDSEFVELLQKGFAQQLNYRKQIRSLIEARDRLLPKLMNGEIEV